MTTPDLAPAPDLAEALRRGLDGDVRFDGVTRQIFSTDASMYAVAPLGVVFPRHAGDLVAAVEIASRHGAPVLPRGAGTSHCGQTIGEAVVLDCSRHMDALVALDPDSRTARVQPGLVQDALNAAAAPHGLWFGPDTSTSNRATLGGMIGNNSCGSRSAVYGMTIDHVQALDVVLADGRRARLDPQPPDAAAVAAHGQGREAAIWRHLSALVDDPAKVEIVRNGTEAFWRRAGGYRLDRLVDRAHGDGLIDPAKLVVGSEGTLVVIAEATVDLVDKPANEVIAVGHFASTSAAIDATNAAMACGASGVELVDKTILDLARSSPEHASATDLLEGDPGAVLFVEFYCDEVTQGAASLDALERAWNAEGHGYAVVRATTPAEKGGVRRLRKAGLGVLMNAGRGNERSLAFVEDTAVDPAVLAEYATDFAAVLDRHGLRAGFYGHASAGCLHIRPFMDLGVPGEVERMRAVAGEVRDLVASYGGVNSSEHGDGRARSEFNRVNYGDDLYELMRELKQVFDPHGILNPGNVVDAGPMTANLREPAMPAGAPLPTHFSFGEADGMRGAANRCMRIGACRKGPISGGAMCPSYMATRDEAHSTRGRANALVGALSQPDPAAAMGDQRLYEVLDLCLECKACKSECPLSVDMATLKSEFLAQYYERHGVPMRAKLFGGVRTFYRLGAQTAPVSNLAARTPGARALAERVFGIHRARPLPAFRRETLPRWFNRRPAPAGPFPRGEVVFLADSFTSYTEPDIGRAAIELLERAGWRVRLESGVCCGRPQISKGLLNKATARARTLVDTLSAEARRGVPITGCEPSCLLTLSEEHPALLAGHDGVEAVAGGARLVDDLLAEALADGSLRVNADRGPSGVVYHGHCHQKALVGTAATQRLLESLGVDVEVLDAGCCGMAGSFGFEREHYDLSLQIGAQRLFPAVDAAAPGVAIAASGVSCRQQIAHGTGRPARHPVELLRDAVR